MRFVKNHVIETFSSKDLRNKLYFFIYIFFFFCTIKNNVIMAQGKSVISFCAIGTRLSSALGIFSHVHTCAKNPACTITSRGGMLRWRIRASTDRLINNGTRLLRDAFGVVCRRRSSITVSHDLVRVIVRCERKETRPPRAATRISDCLNLTYVTYKLFRRQQSNRP